MLIPRPGLFYAERHNEGGWYIVDPSAPAGPTAAEYAWTEQWQQTNVSKSRKVFAAVLAGALGLAVIVAGYALLFQTIANDGSHASQRGQGTALAAIPAVGVFIAVSIFGALAWRKAKRKKPTPPVKELSESIGHWDGAERLSLDDLWELNEGIGLLETCWGAHRSHYERVSEFNPDYLDALRRQQQALSVLASRLSFPVPKELMEVPGYDNLGDYRQPQ
jgi:hypothetical protein